MTPTEQALASFTLTTWVVVVSFAMLRTNLAGLLCGRWFWMKTRYAPRVFGDLATVAAYEREYFARRREMLLAIAFGWLPGRVVEWLVGPIDTRITTTIVAVSAAVAVVIAFRGLRRFDVARHRDLAARLTAEALERLESSR